MKEQIKRAPLIVRLLKLPILFLRYWRITKSARAGWGYAVLSVIDMKDAE